MLRNILSFGFASKPLKHKERVKRYMRNPLYKECSKLKKFDYRQKNIKFPININYLRYFVYRPKAYYKYKNNDVDKLKFETMTGNQILYNMLNFEHFTNSEKTMAMLFLSLKDKPEGVDWNTHEITKSSIEILLKKIDGFEPKDFSIMLDSVYRMGIKDQRLWEKFGTIVGLKYMAIEKRYFGRIILPLLKNEHVTEEVKSKLLEVLPNHLRNLNPLIIAKIFLYLVESNKITDYLFNQHFFMVFWKRHSWFDHESAALIIKGLNTYNHVHDKEFYEEDFLASMDENLYKEESESVLNNYIKSLQLLKSNPEYKFEIDKFIKNAKERLLFVSTKLKLIKQNSFIEIVKSDIEYYKQLEKEKIIKKENN